MDSTEDQIYLEHYRLLREMIVHEDHQINTRVGFQVTVQALLVTSASIVLTNQTMRPAFVGMVMLVLSIVGGILGVSFIAAIQAARTEQARVRGTAKEAPCPGYTDVFPLSKNNDRACALQARLQADGQTLFWGFAYAPIVAWSLTLIWIPGFVVALTMLLKPEMLLRM